MIERARCAGALASHAVSAAVNMSQSQHCRRRQGFTPHPRDRGHTSVLGAVSEQRLRALLPRLRRPRRCARRRRGGAAARGAGLPGARPRAPRARASRAGSALARAAVRHVGAAAVQLLVARHQVRPVRPQPVEEDVAHRAAQEQRLAADRASPRPPSASSTISSTCSGASLMPGISGAIRTPVGIPARLSSATASSRARGCGVCGSVARHAFSSSVGTDRHALTRPRARRSPAAGPCRAAAAATS